MNCYYFGTFDPIHTGHLKIADFVKKKYGFDKVIFVPSPKSPFKQNQISIKDRINMLKLVLREDEISDIELKLKLPNYTYKTIEQLGKCYFIIGFDQFKNIKLWKNYEYLKEQLFFIVIPRQGANIKEFDNYKNEGFKFEILNDFNMIDISSSDIRKKVSAKSSIDGLVSKDVERYIYEKRLYSKLA